MLDWRIITGTILGLLLGVAVILMSELLLPADRNSQGLPSHGSLISDCDNSLRELVIHYLPESNVGCSR